MTVEYNFDIYDTANDKVAPGALSTAIEASPIAVELSHINTDGDDINIYFSSALSSQEETTLSGIVSAHLGIALEERHDPARHAHDFTELFDTPTTYSGAAPKSVKVSETEQNLEFVKDAFSLSLHRSPQYNGRLSLAGWYFTIASGVNLHSGETIEPCSSADNSYFALNVTSASGAPFNITISGSVATTSVLYEEYIDTITVTGTGYYKTNHKFTNGPDFSIAEVGKSCVFDLYKYFMWDFNKSKIIIKRLHLGWVPDEENWQLTIYASKIHADGRRESITGEEGVTFSYSDLYRRASQAKPGVFDTGGFSVYIDGSAGEGLVSYMTQTFIGEVSLEIWYEETA